MDDKQVEVKKMMMAAPMLVSRELVEDSMILPPGVNIFDWMAERERRFKALPPEEQARILAECEAERAAAKAERTCPHCGCDPDEHGGC